MLIQLDLLPISCSCRLRKPVISGQIVGLDVSTDSFILVLGPKLFLPLRNVIGFPSKFFWLAGGILCSFVTIVRSEAKKTSKQWWHYTVLIDILKNGRMIIQRRLFSFLHVSVPMYVSHVSVSLGRQNILNIQSLFPIVNFLTVMTKHASLYNISLLWCSVLP